MFFSRLGEPAGQSQSLQRTLRAGLSEADDGPVDAVQGVHAFGHLADFQRLPVAQASLGRRVELGTRQAFEQR